MNTTGNINLQNPADEEHVLPTLSPDELNSVAQLHPEQVEEPGNHSKNPLNTTRKIIPLKPDNQSKRNPDIGSVSEMVEGISQFTEHLIAKNIVSRALAEKAVAWRKSHEHAGKRRLLWTLIEEFGVDRETVFAEFVRYYSMKAVDLSLTQMDEARMAFIRKIMDSLSESSRELAEKNQILPFEVSPNDQRKIHLITPDPTNRAIATVARAFPYAKYEVQYVSLASYEELWRGLTVDLQNHPLTPKVEIVEEDEEIDLEQLEEEIRKGQLSETFENTLISAVRMNASDIHIIPKGGRKVEFYFRVDGYLSLWQTLERVRVEALAAVVKEIAKGPDRFERDMAQDGFFQMEVDEKIVRFRVSIIPIVGRDLKIKAESVVIRVLQDPQATITIDNIGMAPEALERFKRAIDKPHGIVILTGPTGSGKSTTLLAALRAVMTPQLNTITVEDPVEYLIEGARQVKLNPKLDFEGALRAILRHDPDIVMVGEIRDKMSADIAVKLANTGHLTFSSLHTNDAPSVIARLYKMGVEPFLLAYAINIIVAQRLIRKLCGRCKEVDDEVTPKALQKLGFPMEEFEKTTFYRPVGCIHCFKGYKGRTAIHEVLYFTKEIRQLILDAGASINEEAIRQTAIKQGMRKLMDAALDVLKKGVTTIEEVAASATDD